MMPGLSAQEVCGADLIGANFVVKGKLPTK